MLRALSPHRNTGALALRCGASYASRESGSSIMPTSPQPKPKRGQHLLPVLPVAHLVFLHARKVQHLLDLRSAVHAKDEVNVAGTAEDNGAALVNVGRHEVEHALHRAVEHARRGDAARGLNNESHRKALIEHAQLPLRALLVGRVDEAAAVEDRAVHVRHHRADVARRVLLFLEELHGLLARRVPVEGVALIARVNLLATISGQAHVRMRVDELAQRRVERKPLYLALLEAHHKLCRRTVHAVARRNDVVAGAEDVLHGAQGRGGCALVHRKDGTRAHVAVDIGGSVKGIKCDAEASRILGGHNDRLLVLLRNEDGARARLDEGIDEDIV
mmetsp:Transcript_18226/g.46677  ORF Transcript_18226/g.46677 Transcript_18226/m.46677 type:complete len:331 (+) Transcript_18226:209-1201(+)